MKIFLLKFLLYFLCIQGCKSNSRPENVLQFNMEHLKSDREALEIKETCVVQASVKDNKEDEYYFSKAQ